MQRNAYLLAVALLVPIGLAGCAQDAPTESTDDAPLVTIDENRPSESFGEVSTGPAVQPDLNATTAAAPELVMGEWWRIQFQGYLGGEIVEVVRVVADVNDDGYIMGMPHEGWLKEAISFHSPAFGDVNFDLSYDTHNVVFAPVRFPLVAGDSWETHFAATPYTATVESADEYTATIRFTPPEPATPDPAAIAFELAGLGGGEMVLEYDARQHEIIRMESAIGSWEVVEHGYDYEGWVTVPRGEHTAIDYGTFGPISDTHTPMERELTVEGDFNRMTMMHLVGTVGDAPGAISIRDVLPDGTEWMTELTGSGLEISFYETNAPSGTWTVEDRSVGAGFTYSMGIAYFQYDILLPTGERRADHGHAVIR